MNESEIIDCRLTGVETLKVANRSLILNAGICCVSNFYVCFFYEVTSAVFKNRCISKFLIISMNIT